MLDTVRWAPAEQDAPFPGKLRLIDQTRLPLEFVYLETDDLDTIYDAIRRLVVRGAPAIGCAAALGLAAVCQHSQARDPAQFQAEVERHADVLASARPTAVNLFWALDRCRRTVRAAAAATPAADVGMLKELLLEQGLQILHEDTELCRQIGRHGLELFGGRRHVGVLTHCNAGALATSDYGTALSPVYAAQQAGLQPRVFADETRPLLQGARLTAWELMRAGVDVTLICDNMAATVMREKKVEMVIVGADRIAANGDTANKIGTYAVAILARYHDIPLYVAAPYSTIDPALAEGSGIPIEQRDPAEVACGFGRRTAPENCQVYNPAFDVTPHDLITGIITERGILRPPYDASIAAFLQDR
jgi:methylthioribose-1-phosphate isomerase